MESAAELRLSAQSTLPESLDPQNFKRRRLLALSRNVDHETCRGVESGDSQSDKDRSPCVSSSLFAQDLPHASSASEDARGLVVNPPLSVQVLETPAAEDIASTDVASTSAGREPAEPPQPKEKRRASTDNDASSIMANSRSSELLIPTGAVDDEIMSTSAPHSPARDGHNLLGSESDALPSPDDLSLSEPEEDDASPPRSTPNLPLPKATERPVLEGVAALSQQSLRLATLSSLGASASPSKALTRSSRPVSPSTLRGVAGGDSFGGSEAPGASEGAGVLRRDLGVARCALRDAADSQEGVMGEQAAVESSAVEEEEESGADASIVRKDEKESSEEGKLQADYDSLAALIQDALGGDSCGASARAPQSKRRRNAHYPGELSAARSHSSAGSRAATQSACASSEQGRAGGRGGGEDFLSGTPGELGDAAREESSRPASSLRLHYDPRNGGVYDEEDAESAQASLSFLLGQHGTADALSSALASSWDHVSASQGGDTSASDVPCSVYTPGQHGRPSQSRDPVKERMRRLAKDRETLKLSSQIASRFKSCRTEDVMRLLRRYLAASTRQVRDPETLERVVAACCYISSRQAMDGLSLSDICHELDAGAGQDAGASSRDSSGLFLKEAAEDAVKSEVSGASGGASSMSMRCKCLGRWVVRICRKLQLNALPAKEDDPEDRANRVLARVKQLLVAKMEEDEQRRPQLVDALLRAATQATEKKLPLSNDAPLEAFGSVSSASFSSCASSSASIDFLLGDHATTTGDRWKEGDDREALEAERSARREERAHGREARASAGAEELHVTPSGEDAPRRRRSTSFSASTQQTSASAPAESREQQALNDIEELLKGVGVTGALESFGSASFSATGDFDTSSSCASGDTASSPASQNKASTAGGAKAGEKGSRGDQEGRDGALPAKARHDDAMDAAGEGNENAATSQAEKMNSLPALLTQDVAPSLFNPVPEGLASASRGEDDALDFEALFQGSADLAAASPFSPVLTSLLSSSLPSADSLSNSRELQPSARLQLQRFTWLQKMRTEALEKLKKEKDAVFRGLVLLQRVLKLFYDSKGAEENDAKDDSAEKRDGKKKARGWTEEDPLDSQWRARGRCDSVSLASLIIIVFKWMQIPVSQRIVLEALHVDRKSVYKRRMEQTQILSTLFGRLRGLMSEKKQGVGLQESSAASATGQLASSLPPHLSALLQQVVENPATMQRLLALTEEDEDAEALISLSQAHAASHSHPQAEAGNPAVPAALQGASSPARASLLTPEEGTAASATARPLSGCERTAVPAETAAAARPSPLELGEDRASSPFLAAFLAQMAIGAGDREAGPVSEERRASAGSLREPPQAAAAPCSRKRRRGSAGAPSRLAGPVEEGECAAGAFGSEELRPRAGATGASPAVLAVAADSLPYRAEVAGLRGSFSQASARRRLSLVDAAALALASEAGEREGRASTLGAEEEGERGGAFSRGKAGGVDPRLALASVFSLGNKEGLSRAADGLPDAAGKSEAHTGRRLLELGNIDAPASFALGFTLAEALLRRGLSFSPSHLQETVEEASKAAAFAAAAAPRRRVSEGSEEKVSFSPDYTPLRLPTIEGNLGGAGGGRSQACCRKSGGAASASPLPSPQVFREGREREERAAQGGGGAGPEHLFLDSRATRDIIASFLAGARGDALCGPEGTGASLAGARGGADDDVRAGLWRGESRSSCGGSPSAFPAAYSPTAHLSLDTPVNRHPSSFLSASRRKSSRCPALPHSSATSLYRSRGAETPYGKASTSPSSLFAAAASMAGVLPSSLSSSSLSSVQSSPCLPASLSPASLDRQHCEGGYASSGSAQGLGPGAGPGGVPAREGECDDGRGDFAPNSPMSQALSLLRPASLGLAATSVSFFGAEDPSGVSSCASPRLSGAISASLATALAAPASAAGAARPPQGAPHAVDSSSIAMATVAHLKAAEKALLDSVPDSARVVSLQFERTQQRWVCKWQRHRPAGAPANRKEPWHRRCFSVIKYGYEGAHALAAAVAKKLRDGRRALLQKQRRIEEAELAAAHLADGLPRHGDALARGEPDEEEEGALVAENEADLDSRVAGDEDAASLPPGSPSQIRGEEEGEREGTTEGGGDLFAAAAKDKRTAWRERVTLEKIAVERRK